LKTFKCFGIKNSTTVATGQYGRTPQSVATKTTRERMGNEENNGGIVLGRGRYLSTGSENQKSSSLYTSYSKYISNILIGRVCHGITERISRAWKRSTSTEVVQLSYDVNRGVQSKQTRGFKTIQFSKFESIQQSQQGSSNLAVLGYGFRLSTAVSCCRMMVSMSPTLPHCDHL
jgi:hypothetical protein